MLWYTDGPSTDSSFLMSKGKAECVIFIWAQKKKATSGTKRRKELTRDRYASAILS